MRRVRRILFWLHLMTGMAAGAVILVMSVTGVLLTYQRQLTAWADTRGLDGAAPHASARTLPPESLLAAARSVNDAAPSAIRWRAEADAPVEVVFGHAEVVYLNAFTGHVLGTGSERMRSFFRTITDWHRWLAGQGEARARGRAITGAANLAFLFLVLSGLWLWWPRRWSAGVLRNILWFRRGLRPKARDFNWHNVVGFWLLLPLAIVVASGVVISYPWASDLVYRLAGDEPPAARGAAPARGSREQPPAGVSAREGRTTVPLAAVPALLAVVQAESEGWRSITLQLEPADRGGVSFAVDRGDGGQPQLRSTLVLDAGTRQVLKRESFSDVSPGRRLRSLLRFAHTGEVAGLLGQTVAGIASLGAVVLVLTGVSLAVRRLAAWWQRTSPPEQQSGSMLVGSRRTRRGDIPDVRSSAGSVFFAHDARDMTATKE